MTAVVAVFHYQGTLSLKQAQALGESYIHLGVRHIQIKEKVYWKSLELDNGLIIDISRDWKILGIEIPKASKIFKGDTKKIIEENIPA